MPKRKTVDKPIKYNLVITEFDFDGRMLSYEIIHNVVYSAKRLRKTLGIFNLPDITLPTNKVYQTTNGYKSLIWIDRETRNFTSDHS